MKTRLGKIRRCARTSRGVIFGRRSSGIRASRSAAFRSPEGRRRTSQRIAFFAGLLFGLISNARAAYANPARGSETAARVNHPFSESGSSLTARRANLLASEMSPRRSAACARSDGSIDGSCWLKSAGLMA
ncbi:MAG: hypothetical protein E3J69_00055 [Anaerolineales bacterium]|nr:MAG: hypothetical protein E3J69_00055 [Anaerolineales bacterium]